MRSLFFGEISSDDVVLEGTEGHHAADVLRVMPGEEIDVSDNSGQCAVVRVEAVSKGLVSGRVLSRREVSDPIPHITIALALLKGESMSEAVDLLTQVGVRSIIPWSAERSIAHWRGDRQEKAATKLRHAVLAAAKQSRNPRVPEVSELHDTEHLVSAARNFDRVVVLHEESSTPLASMGWSGIQTVLLVVGPEGGIAPSEIDLLGASGAEVCRLGPQVLRAAHAGAIAAALVHGATSWMSVGQ